MQAKTVDHALHFIPWEDRAAGCSEVVWRYSGNPIIPRNLTPTSNSIFNSAVAPFNGAFAGVFRCDNKKREMNLHRGFSADGIAFKIDPEPIAWSCEDPELRRYEYRYDPRLTWIEDRYRSAPYLLSPQTLYECVGDVPTVAFPCAAFYEESSGKIAIYYGGADTVMALAFCKVDELLDFLKNNSEL